MSFFIQDKELGLFVGECMGLGFYEAHIKDGTLSPNEKPVPFESREEAQAYLDSWIGGVPDGTEIIEQKE